MAGKIPSFLNGANMIIRIGQVRIAFAQSLSFSRNVSHTAVMGIGAYDVLALEPTGYAASGSMQIVRWTDQALKKRTSDKAKQTRPDALQATAPDTGGVATGALVGNSIVDNNATNPASLLLSTTFDIDIYEKGDDGKEGERVFSLIDCRVSGYNFNFVPGELLIENVSFVCRQIDDQAAQPIIAGK